MRGIARFLDSIVVRLGIMNELLQFFLQNKWWWLAPMLIVLFVLGVVIIFAQSSAISVFIYTLF
jgi:hypothetical protein